MASMEEQETTVSYQRGDKWVYIYTANLVHLRTLRKDDRATETRSGLDWAEFIVPHELFDPLRGFKRARKPMTDEHRAAAAENMRKARAAKGKI